MRRGPLVAIGIGLVLMLGVPIILPLVSADPYHLQIENADDSGGTDRIRTTSWIAQSFVPETPFTITRVSILAEANGGSARVIASLRDDDSGFPEPIDITSGIGDGPGWQAWVDVDLNDWVDLVENTTFWLVARSNTFLGYDWYHSPGDSAYPNGTGARSPDGSNWSPESKDYTFRIYGYHRPQMTYSVTPSETVLEPGETGQFRIDLNNSGPGVAEALWVNVTLPSELSYVSDDAGDIGGVMSCCHSYQFSNLTPGSYSYNITFVVDGGVPNGTLTVTNLNFESVDHAAYSPPAEQRQVPITVASGNLTTSLVADLLLVDPGDLLTTDLTIENRGGGSALNVQVETWLDVNATYLSSSPTGTYDAIDHSISWSTPIIGPQSSAVISWDVEVNVGTPDAARVASIVDVAYEDASGFGYPTLQDSVQSSVQAPSFSPILRVDRDSVERGDEVEATFYFNNTGSVQTPEAWMNWSLGGNYEVIDVTPTLPYEDSADGISFTLSEVGPGFHSLMVRLRTIRGLADGEDVGLSVTWEARDGNGNRLPTASLPSTIVLNAPKVAIELEASALRLEVGQVLILNITMNNVGKATAVGWLNLTVPDGFVYLGTESGAYEVAADEDKLSWTLDSLGPESGTTLSVRLHLISDPGLTTLRFSLAYTDGKGSPPETINSNTIFVEPIPVGPGIETVAFWAIMVAIAATVALLLILRWLMAAELSIEEVFVIHRDGLLLAHRSKTLTPDKDQDLLVAMFKTVQDFIRDAFGSREDVPVRSLTFGEFNILIEQGTSHHVAVVYKGKDGGALATQLSLLSQRIESDFGRILESWNGDMDDIHGIRDLLPLLWGPRAGVMEGKPGEEEFDRVKADIGLAWDWIRGVARSVWERLRAEPAFEKAEIETSANGGWE